MVNFTQCPFYQKVQKTSVKCKILGLNPEQTDYFVSKHLPKPEVLDTRLQDMVALVERCMKMAMQYLLTIVSAICVVTIAFRGQSKLLWVFAAPYMMHCTRHFGLVERNLVFRTCFEVLSVMRHAQFMNPRNSDEWMLVVSITLLLYITNASYRMWKCTHFVLAMLIWVVRMDQ
jgi:hypothetical protein